MSPCSEGHGVPLSRRSGPVTGGGDSPRVRVVDVEVVDSGSSTCPTSGSGDQVVVPGTTGRGVTYGAVNRPPSGAARTVCRGTATTSGATPVTLTVPGRPTPCAPPRRPDPLPPRSGKPPGGWVEAGLRDRGGAGREVPDRVGGVKGDLPRGKRRRGQGRRTRRSSPQWSSRRPVLHPESRTRLRNPRGGCDELGMSGFLYESLV